MFAFGLLGVLGGKDKQHHTPLKSLILEAGRSGDGLFWFWTPGAPQVMLLDGFSLLDLVPKAPTEDSSVDLTENRKEPAPGSMPVCRSVVSACCIFKSPGELLSRYYYLGPGPDQLNQNLLGVGPRLQDILKLPGDGMCHQH